MSEEWVSTSELIKRASADGICITHRTLVSWQNFGAIQSPAKKGLGRGKGSISLYPVSTINQIKILMQYWANKRTLNQSIFNMWVEGYQVDIVPLIHKSISKYRGKLKRYYQKSYGDLELTESGYRFNQRRMQSQILVNARRRVGNVYFDYIVELIIRVLTGITWNRKSGNSSDIIEQKIDTFIHALGDEYQGVIKKSTVSILISIRSTIEHLASLFSFDHLDELANTATDHDLKIAYGFITTILPIIRTELAKKGNEIISIQYDCYQQAMIIIMTLALLKDELLQEIVKENMRQIK